MSEKVKTNWKVIVQFIVTILTSILTTIGTTSCVGPVPVIAGM